MRQAIIEQTDVFTLVSIGNGAAYAMRHKPSGTERFVQYGDDATMFRDEYEAIQAAYLNPETVWYKLTWNDALAYLYSECMADTETN